MAGCRRPLALTLTLLLLCVMRSSNGSVLAPVNNQIHLDRATLEEIQRVKEEVGIELLRRVVVDHSSISLGLRTEIGNASLLLRKSVRIVQDD
ncbi:hypothetical protein GUITHDRAFT_154161, partial [Guillardia theta CCMP2712]